MERSVFVELGRLTHCHPLYLFKFLEKTGLPITRPPETTLRRWWNQAGLQRLAKWNGRSGVKVGCVRVHVVPVMFGACGAGRVPLDMAIFWEPFSRAIFYEVALDFSEADIGRFVGDCLDRLPEGLTRRIQVVVFTNPVQGEDLAATGHWYLTWPRPKTLVTTRQVGKKLLKDRTLFTDLDLPTELYSTLDLRVEDEKKYTLQDLRKDVNSYNISPGQSIFFGSCSGWNDKGEITQSKEFVRGYRYGSPLAKLEAAGVPVGSKKGLRFWMNIK